MKKPDLSLQELWLDSAKLHFKKDPDSWMVWAALFLAAESA